MSKMDSASDKTLGKFSRHNSRKFEDGPVDFARCGRIRINKDTLLCVLTVAGVVLGFIIGLSVRTMEPSDKVITLVMFPGEMLMRMLKMLIIPIIVTSVISGLSNLDMKKSGRMGFHAIAFYLSTTTMAVILGIILVTLIQPGNPTIREDNENESKKQQVVSTLNTFLDLMRNIFPDNIVAACFEVDKTVLIEIPPIESTNGTMNITEVLYKSKIEKVNNANVLGIIAFSIFFGVILSSIKSKATVVVDFFAALDAIFMKMIVYIIWYSPVGICSLIAGNLLKMKTFEILFASLGLYMVTVITGLVIHSMVVLPLIYWVMTKKNPYKFYYGVLQAFLTALGTASSAGTLPVTIQCLEKNLRIDSRVTRFVIPLGATMNMDGTALLEGVAAITIAQMYNYSLSFGQILTISVTATVASVGAAAIPSAGLITLLLVLSAIGIPSEAVGILWSVDWLLDRIRTAVNVLGDCMGAGIIQHLNRDLLSTDLCSDGYEDSENMALNETNEIDGKKDTSLL